MSGALSKASLLLAVLAAAGPLAAGDAVIRSEFQEYTIGMAVFSACPSGIYALQGGLCFEPRPGEGRVVVTLHDLASGIPVPAAYEFHQDPVFYTPQAHGVFCTQADLPIPEGASRFLLWVGRNVDGWEPEHGVTCLGAATQGLAWADFYG